VQIHTKAVHVGDRKKPGSHTPVTTPIHTATSYYYETTEQLDRIFGGEESGYCYARYDNPSTAALEELVASLENGAAALACASGMAAIHTALLTALTDRRKSILAASAIYGQSVTLLMNVLEPLGGKLADVWIRTLRGGGRSQAAASLSRASRIRCCAWRRSIDRRDRTAGAALVDHSQDADAGASAELARIERPQRHRSGGPRRRAGRCGGDQQAARGFAARAGPHYRPGAWTV
jgi:hypothetical protein